MLSQRVSLCWKYLAQLTFRFRTVLHLERDDLTRLGRKQQVLTLLAPGHHFLTNLVWPKEK